MFDVSQLTLEEVGEEIDQTISKLSILMAMYKAMQEQDGQRIKKFIADYNRAKQEATP